MAYIRGNLALERAEPQPARAETERSSAGRSALRGRDKLLYLFAVLVGVAVALSVLYRYAQIYEMNVRLHQIESRIQRLEAENIELRRELTRLQDPARIMEKAKELGLELPADRQIAHVFGSGNAAAIER
ncbi:MAG: cell division protein FtsL [Candidatus Reconcilbacillus cellulovorans]|uniref:Cell division protein FtsL n=1 Tax=Candidatus Reconcilbacillus cellulovorans TaxID=1906605 RepID=A0A2A6E2G3_9BACL|nr:MAG: cell division protein FtsL [Candidatus Reconcilbacillus cellulovorans]